MTSARVAPLCAARVSPACRRSCRWTPGRSAARRAVLQAAWTWWARSALPSRLTNSRAVGSAGERVCRCSASAETPCGGEVDDALASRLRWALHGSRVRLNDLLPHGHGAVLHVDVTDAEGH